jgi:hypothetical protein
MELALWKMKENICQRHCDFPVFIFVPVASESVTLVDGRRFLGKW